MTTAGSTAHGLSGAEAAAPHRYVPRPPLAIVGHIESRQSGQSLPTAEPAISFGPFHLLPTQRLLLEADKPLRVGSRALDILIALVERAGEVLGKDDLMACAWPNTFVEEGNLKVQVAALRRILGGGQPGQRYVVNVPGRGYVFVAPVIRKESQRPVLRPSDQRDSGNGANGNAAPNAHYSNHTLRSGHPMLHARRQRSGHQAGTPRSSL